MKILVISPDYSDATSYYRAFGTFNDIESQSDIRFTRYEAAYSMQRNGMFAATWADLIKYDVAFFQRGMGKNSVDLATYLKKMGLKIWYDLDDDLWNIPSYYKIKETYHPKMMGTIEQLIKLADLVTCSTQTLSEVIKEKTNVNAYVINNGWDIKRFPIQEYNAKGKTIWRGSSTHAADLRSQATTLQKISNVDLIEFWGYNPIANSPNLKITNYSFVEPLDPISYFNKLKQSNISKVLVALEDTQFNRSKSNIAWLEATVNGALCYSNNVGEFYHTLNLNQYFSPDLEYDVWIEDVNIILSDYKLSKLNQKRIDLLKSI
jgi:hypothetical protein